MPKGSMYSHGTSKTKSPGMGKQPSSVNKSKGGMKASTSKNTGKVQK